MDTQVSEKLAKMIKEHEVLLFMKGDKESPQCGFSAQVVNILNSYGVGYETVDVLQDWDLREGIKAFSSWPTIPQLYVRGDFVGGCDIAMEMHRKGELKNVLEG